MLAQLGTTHGRSPALSTAKSRRFLAHMPSRRLRGSPLLAHAPSPHKHMRGRLHMQHHCSGSALQARQRPHRAGVSLNVITPAPTHAAASTPAAAGAAAAAATDAAADAAADGGGSACLSRGGGGTAAAGTCVTSATAFVSAGSSAGGGGGGGGAGSAGAGAGVSPGGLGC